MKKVNSCREDPIYFSQAFETNMVIAIKGFALHTTDLSIVREEIQVWVQKMDFKGCIAAEILK